MQLHVTMVLIHPHKSYKEKYSYHLFNKIGEQILSDSCSHMPPSSPPFPWWTPLSPPSCRTLMPPPPPSSCTHVFFLHQIPSLDPLSPGQAPPSSPPTHSTANPPRRYTPSPHPSGHETPLPSPLPSQYTFSPPSHLLLYPSPFLPPEPWKAMAGR